MTTRWTDSAGRDPSTYDDRWRRLAQAGQSIHGEADFVTSRAPGLVLDAGCGTGRVAVELDRRGIEVVGVDVDRGMLTEARAKAPHIGWHEADLSELELRDANGEQQRFDLIILAGNVMIFLAPRTEGQVLRRLADHLAPGGELVAGFQLLPDRVTLDLYDELSHAAGLRLTERYGTWEHEPFTGGGYAVSVTRAATSGTR